MSDAGLTNTIDYERKTKTILDQKRIELQAQEDKRLEIRNSS
jgi:hypothetical protein